MSNQTASSARGVEHVVLREGMRADLASARSLTGKTGGTTVP